MTNTDPFLSSAGRQMQESAIRKMGTVLASGRDVISFAPGAQDVWDLVTTAFGSGGMSPHRDGFAWSSPLGVLGAAVLVAAFQSIELR